MIANGRDEGKRDEAADQVAGDHDCLAIKAIEEYTGERSGQDCRDGARQHDAGDDGTTVSAGDGEAQDGDVVEVIADFTDDLPCPSEAVISIGAKEFCEVCHYLECRTIPERVIAWPR